jgi:hypothetical protein
MAILYIGAVCIPVSMRRIGSLGTSDEYTLPLKISTNSIEMDRIVFFIEVGITKYR